MKKTTSVNLETTVLDFLEQEVQRLSISRNDLIETLVILHVAQQKILLAPPQIEGFIDSFPFKKRGNASQNFRATIRALPSQDAWTLVTFFSALNLIEDVEVSVNRFSNLWKRGETICYFAYGNTIARQSVLDILKKQGNNVAKITNQNFSGGSFFFSCLQQLRLPQKYPHWGRFLQLLNLPPHTTIVEVDGFTLLHTVLPALEQI